MKFLSKCASARWRHYGGVRYLFGGIWGKGAEMKKSVADERVAILELLGKSSLGIGVVFVALITTLPAVWPIRELRGIYAWYLFAVVTSLFPVIVMLVAATFQDEERRRSRLFMMYGGLVGLVIFSFSTIGAAWKVVQALKQMSAA